MKCPSPYLGCHLRHSPGRLLVRFHLQEVVQDLPLLRREVVLVARRVQHCLPLISGNRAQVLKGLLDHPLTVGRQRPVLPVGVANLHLFLGRQAFQHLAARQPALTLRLRHLIQLMQLLHQALLLFRRQPVKARTVAQQTLLVLHGKIAVLVEPVAEMARRSGISLRGRIWPGCRRSLGLICLSRRGAVSFNARARYSLYRPAGLSRRTTRPLPGTILTSVVPALLAAGSGVSPAALLRTVGEGGARNPGIGVRPLHRSSPIPALIAALKLPVGPHKLARLALERAGLALELSALPLKLTPELTLILPLELSVLPLLLAHPGALPGALFRPLALEASACRSGATLSGALGRRNRRRQAHE